MICNKCLKKIPTGEEVQRSGNFYWRAGWWGGGGGSEVVCRPCAKKIRKQEKTFITIIIVLFGVSFITTILVLIINFSK